LGVGVVSAECLPWVRRANTSRTHKAASARTVTTPQNLPPFFPLPPPTHMPPQITSAAEAASEQMKCAAEQMKEKAGYSGAQASDAADEAKHKAQAGMAGAKQDVRRGAERGKGGMTE